MKKCKGENCNSISGVDHSKDCQKEHMATVCNASEEKMKDEYITQGRLRVKAEELWGMLDDISTAGDMFKPDLNDPFVRYVLKKCEEKNKHFVSDGYDLFVTL